MQRNCLCKGCPVGQVATTTWLPEQRQRCNTDGLDFFECCEFIMTLPCLNFKKCNFTAMCMLCMHQYGIADEYEKSLWISMSVLELQSCQVWLQAETLQFSKKTVAFVRRTCVVSDPPTKSGNRVILAQIPLTSFGKASVDPPDPIPIEILFAPYIYIYICLSPIEFASPINPPRIKSISSTNLFYYFCQSAIHLSLLPEALGFGGTFRGSIGNGAWWPVQSTQPVTKALVLGKAPKASDLLAKGRLYSLLSLLGLGPSFRGGTL